MLRRTIAVGATAAVISIAAMVPARAEAPKLKSYDAASSASALEISLTDQTLAVSQTQAAVNGTPQAAADGAALLLAGNAIPGRATSAAPEGPATAEQCPVDLSALTSALAGSGLTLDVACLKTSSQIADSEPSARSESGEVTLRLNGLDAGALAPLGDALEQVLTAALPQGSSLVQQLCEGPLSAICTGVAETTSIDIPDLVDEVFSDLGEISDGAFTLAEIFVAPSLSTASGSPAGIDAAAGSGAITINLFPGLASAIDTVTGLLPGATDTSPLLSVQLAQATAKVHRDAVTGAPTPDASAAQLLSITLTDNLGILSELLGVEVPGTIDSLAAAGAALSCDGGALADVLCIDLGSVNELDAAELEARKLNFGEGTVGREASAAHVEVLGIIAEAAGSPLLTLNLARATAAANAVAADGPPLPGAPAEPVLPHTGGDTTLPLTLALFAVGIAGALLLQRTRSA